MNDNDSIDTILGDVDDGESGDGLMKGDASNEGDGRHPSDTDIPSIAPKRARISEKNRRYVGIAVFSALSFIVALVCQIIPPVAGFLSLDFKDAVIAMASFVYGPLAAVLIALIAAFIEFVTISSTGWYGFIMNFASSAVFSLVASLIYKRKKTLNGALVGFLTAIIATTSVMLLLNIFVTPLYMAQIGVPLDTNGIIDMIPLVLLPFNLSKSVINSALAMMLYKPISSSLRRIGFATGDAKRMQFNRASLLITVGGVVVIVVAVLVLIFVPQMS